ncbi:MAG: glycosyltransferase family 39 protein [Candidatus Sumerlaeia bacterium]
MGKIAVPVLLVVAAIVIYLPAMGGSFLWDDEISIIKNDLLRQADGLWLFWTTIGTVPLEEHYWPITYSALWLEWRLWGEAAVGFHAVNVILHAIVGIQIWRLMRRLGLPGAWLAAALFVAHPVNVEAVAWVISIKGLLAALFFLLCIEFYMNHEERGGRTWMILAATAAAAAMLSKSSPVMLPVALGILAWYRRGRLEKNDWAGVALIAEVVIVLAFVDLWVVRQVLKDAPPAAIPPLADRLAQAGWTFWLYVEKLLWPLNLSPFYPPLRVSAARVADWIPLAAILPVTAGLWLARRRIGRGPVACWVYYGVMLGPILGIVYFSFLRLSPAGDRYQYLAMIAPVAGAGALAGAWIERGAGRARIARAAPAVAVLAALASLTFRQAGIYRDQETLFRHAVAVAPDSAEAQYDLATTLLRTNPAEAEKYYAETVRLKPDHWAAVCNLGILQLSQDRFADAARTYQQALDRGCPDTGVFQNYAWILAASPEPGVRKPQQALELANRVMQEPRAKTDPEVYSLLAAAQAANGRFDEALDMARQGRQIALETRQYDSIRKLVEMIGLFMDRQPYVLPRESVL